MGRTRNENIVKLYMTAGDTKHYKEKSKNSESEDSIEEIEYEKEAPKKIIEKLIDKDTKIEISGDIVSQIFTYEEADVLVILDKNKKPWYKGKDIATILEYVDTQGALSRHVDKKYKKSYSCMGLKIHGSEKIDPQTIFINNTGLFNLVVRSKKPEAIKLWEYISDEILPELFTKGTYTMPAKESDIVRLNQSFYDNHMLSDYKDKLAIYLAYIGKYKGRHILKFGKSKDFMKRDLKQHRKMYKTFNVLKIWETIAYDFVEENIKANFASRNMLTYLSKKELQIKCNEKTKRELVELNEVSDLDYCLNMIDDVVKNTIIPQENKYIKEINNLKHENEIEKMQQTIKFQNDMIDNLKGNITDLRSKIKKV